MAQRSPQYIPTVRGYGVPSGQDIFNELLLPNYSFAGKLTSQLQLQFLFQQVRPYFVPQIS